MSRLASSGRNAAHRVTPFVLSRTKRHVSPPMRFIAARTRGSDGARNTVAGDMIRRLYPAICSSSSTNDVRAAIR